jgi:hypothetical protein
MSYPEVPQVPSIQICDGCSETAVLGFVNETNKQRVDSVHSVCGMLALAEVQTTPEDAINMLTQAVDRGCNVLADEKTIVDRVNGLNCHNFCARIVSYSHDGGVYLGQSYRKPPLKELDTEDPSKPVDPPE